MSNKKKRNNSWFARHRKGIIITSSVLSVVFGTAGLLIYCYPDETKSILNTVKGQITTVFNRSIQTVSTSSYVEVEVSESITAKITEIVSADISKRPYAQHSGPFPVSGGPVKLPQGRHPSPEKIELGRKMGLDFEALGITWRNNFIKGAA